MNKPWVKEDRKQKAIAHTQEMSENCVYWINRSILNSKAYYNGDLYKLEAKVIIEDMTTTEAICKYSRNVYFPLCALNFASYKYPGGGFIIGAIAQEEALCHDSYLYNVIGSDKFAALYEQNRNKLELGEVNTLYENFAIWSPNIIFKSGTEQGDANIVTCPAPNLSVGTISKVEGYEAMRSRIKFVLDIMQKYNQKTIILGAFGCGVFKNDPNDVAYLFKAVLEAGSYTFENIVFAIPAGPNYDAFKKVFG